MNAPGTPVATTEKARTISVEQFVLGKGYVRFKDLDQQTHLGIFRGILRILIGIFSDIGSIPLSESLDHLSTTGKSLLPHQIQSELQGGVCITDRVTWIDPIALFCGESMGPGLLLREDGSVLEAVIGKREGRTVFWVCKCTDERLTELVTQEPRFVSILHRVINRLTSVISDLRRQEAMMVGAKGHLDSILCRIQFTG